MSPLAVSAKVEGAVVVMTPDMRFIELDPVGAEIWELLAAGSSLGEIATELTQRYEVELDTALSDAQRFITYLTDEGVVSLSE